MTADEIRATGRDELELARETGEFSERAVFGVLIEVAAQLAEINDKLSEIGSRHE
jgi:hypothetical protein